MMDILSKDKAGTKEGRTVVLLVDDQPMVAEAIRRMLADEQDIEFYYCAVSSRAVIMAKEVAPTVILQDLIMPDLDGITLMRFYRANESTRDIPVIVLSSKDDPRDKSQAFGAGASDYLVKLPDKIELIARIRAHSKSYLAQMQRDEAFKKLRELQKQLEASNTELQRLSCLDGLTGIANRRHFDTYLEQEWLRASREGVKISLVLTDLDYFKAYNDNYGHQAGDDCLKKVASVFKAVIQRPGDMVARYGGEEFVVVLPNTDIDGAVVLAEAIHSRVYALKIPHRFSKATNHMTISIGIATIQPNKKNSPKDLIAMADIALYQAKQHGRNRYVVAPPLEKKPN